MALNSIAMIDILDQYGLTGLPSETEYPTGTEGWDSFPIPWDDVLNPDRPNDFVSETVDAPVGTGPLGRWSEAGREIIEASRRNEHVPAPKDVDALAWYLPFHYFGLDWGIYVKEESVFELARLIYNEMRRPTMTARLAEDLCRMALSILYLHEAFHHKVESFATRLEIATRIPAYRSYKDNVVKVVRGTDAHLEEAVACAEMLTRLDEVAYKKGVEARTRAATKRFVKKWIPTLNPGYRLGLNHLDDQSKWFLQNQIAEGNQHPSNLIVDWAIADNMLRGFYDKDAIAHVMVPVGHTPIIPWLHPIDPLVSVSTDRLVRHLLREFGYVEISKRGKGGHRWFECAAGGLPSFPLPANRESLSPVVLRTVASALGYQSIRDLAQHC